MSVVATACPCGRCATCWSTPACTIRTLLQSGNVVFSSRCGPSPHWNAQWRKPSSSAGGFAASSSGPRASGRRSVKRIPFRPRRHGIRASAGPLAEAPTSAKAVGEPYERAILGAESVVRELAVISTPCIPTESAGRASRRA